MRFLAASLVAAAVLVPTALAHPPDTRTHTDFNSTRTITDCGFPSRSTLRASSPSGTTSTRAGTSSASGSTWSGRSQ